MSALGIIGIAELLLLLLIGVGSGMWLLWQRKKKQAMELEAILEEVKASEVTRQHQLLRHLTLKRKLTETEAQEVSAAMMQAEKQFLQFYVQYRFELGSGADFYTQLTELLDQYLKLVPLPPDPVVPVNVVSFPAPSLQSQVNLSKTEQTLSPATILADADAMPVDDLVAPVATAMSDKITQEEVDASDLIEDQPVNNDEFDEFGDEDIDWGEAFAEVENSKK